MKITTLIKEFIHKAKQEAARDYQLSMAMKKSTAPSAAEKKEYARKGWIGMDLDGTLARTDPLSGISKIGDPVPKMVNLATRLINEGNRVKIFTARAFDADQVAMIHNWLKENGLPELEVTNIKDFEMIRLYDDRAIQVITNTGELVEPS
ncbi:MAG: hypothetical protein RBT11_08385 [Desulfobacterales bacterium]|jgi:hypothetical protein|nr:hypothetical protein [Desulfobacterales bacterium]